MKKKILVSLLLLGICNSYAGTININNPKEVGDSTAYLMPTSLPTEFNQVVSMDRSFNNMEQFAARLQSLSGFKVQVNNIAEDVKPQHTVKIYQIKGTLASLLDQAALKFNARWKFDPQNVQIILMYNEGISKKVIIAKREIAYQKSLPIDLQTRTWIINKNDFDLRTALSRWCEKSGWQLDWQVQGKFPIDFDWQVQGTFRDAVNQVLKATQQSEIPLTATMYTKNKVLKISSVGN